jgi:hypothetical protein
VVLPALLIGSSSIVLVVILHRLAPSVPGVLVARRALPGRPDAHG